VGDVLISYWVYVHAHMNTESEDNVDPVPRRMPVVRRYTSTGIPLHPITETKVNNIIRIEQAYAIHDAVSVAVENNISPSDAQFAEPLACVSDARLTNEYRGAYKQLRILQNNNIDMNVDEWNTHTENSETTGFSETNEDRFWKLVRDIEPILERRNIPIPIVDSVSIVRIPEAEYVMAHEKYELLHRFTHPNSGAGVTNIDVLVTRDQLEWLEEHVDGDVRVIETYDEFNV